MPQSATPARPDRPWPAIWTGTGVSGRRNGLIRIRHHISVLTETATPSQVVMAPRPTPAM
ncbi:hypothetical protein SynWH8101_1754 [Synechococcus sp. WH 8101]|nr:hypothetical protein SynWH8101_1754 [Synechococcus sp. WH 8101]QNI45577.1 hypothetical protein SynRCC2555_01796 [Synechococcus sp. WH 8101]